MAGRVPRGIPSTTPSDPRADATIPPVVDLTGTTRSGRPLRSIAGTVAGELAGAAASALAEAVTDGAATPEIELIDRVTSNAVRGLIDSGDGTPPPVVPPIPTSAHESALGTPTGGGAAETRGYQSHANLHVDPSNPTPSSSGAPGSPGGSGPGPNAELQDDPEPQPRPDPEPNPPAPPRRHIWMGAAAPIPPVSGNSLLAANTHLPRHRVSWTMPIPTHHSGRSTQYSYPAATKVGDHSITSEGVADSLVLNLPALNPVGSTFLSAAKAYVVSTPQSFGLVGDGITIRSRLNPAGAYMQWRNPQSVEYTVFTAAARRMADDTILDKAKVVFGTPIQKGVVDISLLSAYLRGPLPNTRQIQSDMQGYLPSTTQNFWANTQGAIQSNLTLFDNSAIYAKLAYHALVIDLQERMGYVSDYVAWGQDSTLNWRDLTGNAGPDDFLTDVAKPAFILVDGTDYCDGDEQPVLWLARAGQRITAPANQRCLDAAYVEWPEVEISIYGLRANPIANNNAWPACAAVTSDELLGFAMKLARNRGEMYDLCRGIYYALDLVGVRYIMGGPAAARRYYRFSTFMGREQPVMPRPMDYNFFARVLAAVSPTGESRDLEVQSWLSSRAQTRAHMATFYCAGMMAMVATSLTSVNIAQVHLRDWLLGVGGELFANEVVRDFATPDPTTGEEPLGFSLAKRAFAYFTGYIPETDMYRHTNWLGAQGSDVLNANAAFATTGIAMDNPPRWGSLLAVDDFLLIRPLEWGILSPGAKIDFARDVRLSAVQASQGVLSQRGCSDYFKAVTSSTPHVYIPYGVQMINAVTQFFGLGNNNARYFSAPYNEGIEGEFSNQSAQYGATYYNAQLRVYEPTSVWTFDYGDAEVRAPCIMYPTVTTDQIYQVDTWRNTAPPNIGFLLKRRPNMARASARPTGLGPRPSLRALAGMSTSTATSAPGVSTSGTAPPGDSDSGTTLSASGNA